MGEQDAIWVSGEAFPFTSSQVKRAGGRIRYARAGSVAPRDDDLSLLDSYRASHYPALRHMQDRLIRLFHKKAGIDPQVITITARPLKTPEAIIAKLVRERTRLNTMNDIAGARIVVPHRGVQDAALGAILVGLRGLQPRVEKDSRDDGDAHGYRAIHVLVTASHEGIGPRLAEIQIRTVAEDAWAQLVEGLDSVLRSDLKHGDGPGDFKQWLLETSAAIAATARGEPTTILPEMPPRPFQTP